MIRTTATTLTGLASLLVVACGGGEQPPQQAETAAAPAAQAAPAGSGTITGTVSFTGTAPANPAIDMASEAACVGKHPGGATDPQIVVTDGKLANVFVYVKSGLPAGASYPAPTTPVVLDQDGCLYRPRVFGVMVGQDIEIRNSDSVSHNIKAVPTANRGFNISQPRQGMSTTRRFDAPEVMVPLECNVHGWMNAFAGVMSHPHFAVSGDAGTFSISGLPAGTYEIEAWHEKLGTRTMTVTVAEGGTATADFAFGPK
jgi:plastocyanin